MKKNHKKIVQLCCTAVLMALIIFMSFTGFGYIPVGPLKLTLNALPVAIGGAVLGPYAGLVLGATFGLTSFATCFGMDPFGTALFGIDPVETFLMCVVPRILCGVLPALMCYWLRKCIANTHWNQIWTSALSCGLTALINTVLFLGALWLFFGHDLATNAQLIEMLGGAMTSFWAVLIGFAGVNAILEVALNLTAGTAISKALLAAMRR